MPSSPLDLQNNLELGDDALEIFTCRTRSVTSVWMPSNPLDLQNTLEVGDDALDAFGALGLQNKVGGLGVDALEPP